MSSFAKTTILICLLAICGPSTTWANGLEQSLVESKSDKADNAAKPEPQASDSETGESQATNFAENQFRGAIQHSQSTEEPIKFSKSKFQNKGAKFVVPVFFATDRRNASANSNSFDFKEQVIDNVEHITYGVFTDHFSLSDYHPSGSPALRTCSYSTISKQTDQADAQTTEKGSLEFTELCNSLKNAGAQEKGVLIHVHGCCMGFNYAAHEAAMTAAWLNTPVVLYDWGSPFGAYAGSLQACERSQERFNRFLTELRKEVPANKITILGFSLGNQLIMDHCLQNNGTVAYKDIIMVRPDVDLIAFKSHLPKLSRSAEQLHLYLAKNDLALHFSGTMRKLANPWAPAQRLGVAQPTFFEYPNLTILDVSKVDPLHSIPNAVMADIARNDGLIPACSDHYEYSRNRNGVLEVLKR